MNVSEQIIADIIILSWNRTDDTIAAIRSASAQRGVGIRILIVDQGSTEENLGKLEAALSTTPNCVLRKLSQNAGVAGGRNIASALGTGRYIIALDNDAEFSDPYCVARAVAAMESDPQLCAVAFRIDNYFTGENDTTSWDYGPQHSPTQRFNASKFVGAGHAIRRSVFEQVGAYDEALFFCGEETDLCYRMLNTGAHIIYDPSISVRHKVAPEHRVVWNKGRFYYTVRNSLYTMHKFGMPWARIAIAAGSFLTRALRNGLVKDAARGIRDSLGMARKHSRHFGALPIYRLSPVTWRYIRECEPWRSDSLLVKTARQFRSLPHQR